MESTNQKQKNQESNVDSLQNTLASNQISQSQLPDSTATQQTTDIDLNSLQQPTSSQTQTGAQQEQNPSPNTTLTREDDHPSTIMKIVGWYYFFLGPLSLVTAVLSFLRSGDTFVEPLPYILFGILNLVLLIFYLKLSEKLRKQGGKNSKTVGLVMLPISLIILAFSTYYLYSLVFLFP